MVMHTSSGILENIIGDCNTVGNVLSNIAVLFSFGTIEQKEKRALYASVGRYIHSDSLLYDSRVAWLEM